MHNIHNKSLPVLQIQVTMFALRVQDTQNIGVNNYNGDMCKMN